MHDSLDPDSFAAWQVRLFKKSVTQQAKLKNIQCLLSPTQGKICLDVGGDNGVLPYMLRRNGGQWMSVESDGNAIDAMRDLFGEEQVVPIEGAELPFEDNTFDTIVVIDYLEHIRDDALFMKECHRCLKSNGELVINVPHVKSFSVIRGLRRLVKLTDKKQGHVRPGYRLQELYAISKNGYDIVESQPYGGFFVEFINVWLQVASGSSAPEFASTVKANKGPLDQQELRKFATLFRTHRISYPFQKIAQGLDALFPFTKTHCLVVKAKPRPWNERKGVHMRDGRSIADATINTRIGSAANLTDPKNNRSSAS